MSWPSNDRLKAQLVQNGYTGQINDALVAYLSNLYTLSGRSYNDLLYYHLGQLGYTGSLNDRIKQWDGTLWSPASLFSSSEQGLWLDFFDTTTTFQDSAATTPAVATTDPIGYVGDKSGNGNHVTQVVSGAKFTLGVNTAGKVVAVTDGFDDFMATAATLNLTATDEVTVFAAVRKLSDAAQGMVCELSATTVTNAGTFNIQAPNSTTIELRSVSRGDGTAASADANDVAYAAPLSSVLMFEGKISTHVNILSVNGTQAATSAVDQGLGNYGNYTLYIGMRAGTSAPLNAELTSLIIVGKLCSAADKAAVLAYQASAMGLSL